MTRKDTERKQRYCLVCGRPLTGRKRKYCGHPDCGGWSAAHPATTEVCVSCSEVFDTYVGSGREKCPMCEHRATALRHPMNLSSSEIFPFSEC
jgi:hypothetical protein